MKYSIDINLTNKTISGWAATSDGLDIKDGIVSLRHIETTLETTSLSAQRDDVKKAKLHHSGKCGFAFKEVEKKIQPNKIYNVTIKSQDEEVQKTIFFGDLQSALAEFSGFEIDRNDLTIMEPPTRELQTSSCDFLLLKKLLIRLRRAKRAKGFRGNFTGIQYNHQTTDWHLFDKLINTHHDFFLSVIDTRYLWSFIDTYADFGSPDERLAALAVSNLLYQERFAQTLHCIYDFKPKEKPTKEIQLRYWDGMGTNCLKADDSYDVFLTRNLEVLSTTPLIKTFFKEFIRRSTLHPDSIIRFNIDNSDHFKDALSFYIKNLNSL